MTAHDFLFCRNGVISGNCSAGYFCLSGSDDYTPLGTPPDSDPITNPCPENTVCAGQCPAGSFCPAGTVNPESCPEHTLRDTVGARTIDDCAPCPAGFWCHKGQSRRLRLIHDFLFLKSYFEWWYQAQTPVMFMKGSCRFRLKWVALSLKLHLFSNV